MKRFAPVVLSLAVALLAGACQSEQEAMKIICNAPNDCVECSKVSPEMQAMHLAQYIEKRISNGEAEQLFEKMAIVAPKEKIRLLTARAKAAGLAACPLVDKFKELEREAAKAAP